MPSTDPYIDSLLVADYAEAVNGKLYIMGGGFDTLWGPSVPTRGSVRLCRSSESAVERHEPAAASEGVGRDEGRRNAGLEHAGRARSGPRARSTRRRRSDHGRGPRDLRSDGADRVRPERSVRRRSAIGPTANHHAALRSERPASATAGVADSTTCSTVATRWVSMSRLVWARRASVVGHKIAAASLGDQLSLVARRPSQVFGTYRLYGVVAERIDPDRTDLVAIFVFVLELPDEPGAAVRHRRLNASPSGDFLVPAEIGSLPRPVGRVCRPTEDRIVEVSEADAAAFLQDRGSPRMVEVLGWVEDEDDQDARSND